MLVQKLDKKYRKNIKRTLRGEYTWDLTDQEPADEAEAQAEVILAHQEKCTKQRVEIVAKNVPYLLSQRKANQFIAETVTKVIKSSKN